MIIDTNLVEAHKVTFRCNASYYTAKNIIRGNFYIASRHYGSLFT